nr:phage tail tape measure protein [Pyrinomonadaceae bacterium]
MKVITLKLRIDDGEAIKSIDDLGDGLANLDQTAARQAADSLENLFIKADLKARAIVALTDAVRESFTEFRNFGKEVANLDTLLEGEGQIQSLKKGLLELNPNLGQTSELARGMYQALSSGVEAGEALQFIEKSAKAARAGLATTFETVDAGTSVMASFGLKGQEIGEIYDKMFETVKRGKVEMSQLSQSLGLVTNIAAQAGVTIDEMFGAISTSTRTMRPSSAIEGFRSALSNIIKPAKEASELAEQLGIQFDSTALKTKGFAQFLNDVTKATNGNQQQMATLFGDVQALAFVMSVTGNQANQLAEDIKGVATASGTVDEAFKKQQQSLDAQITTFKNSVLQGFTKVFTEIEPILSGSLRLLNEYPIAVASVVTALGLLVAAYNAVTIAAGISGAIQSISSFGSSLGGTIFVIQNVVRAMLGLQTAFITTGEVAVAATGGWLALIAGVGAVIYAIVQYSQAQQKTTEEQLKSVQASKGQVDTLNQQQKVLSDLQNGVGDLSNRQQQLTDIYGTLNGASLDRVNAATKEKGAVGALADEVERLNKAKGIELEIKVIDLVGRAAKAYEDQKLAVNRAEDATKTYQNAVGNLTPVMEVNAKTGLETGRVLMTVKEQYDQLGVRQNQTSAEAETAKNAFNELKAALDTAARSMGMTTAEFINAKVATGQLDKQSAEFLQTLSNTGNAQDNFANRTQNATDTINQQTAAVKSLRDQLKGLITDTQARVDDKIASIAIGAKDKAEAKKQAESLRKTDTDFKKDLDEIKRLKDNEKAIRDVLQPSEVSSTKKLKAPNPAADFRRENRIFSGNAQWDKYVYEAANKYGIDPMLIFAQMNQESSFKKTAMSNKGASGLMQLMPKTARELGVKNIFDPKENIFAGVKYLRDQLKTFNGNVALGLAAYNAGPGAVIKYGGIPPYKETQEYVKRISDKYQKLKGGKFEMGAGFDYEKSIGELSDKRTKDYRESQTLQAIDFARMTGNAPDADVLRDYHRLKVDEAKRRGDIQPEFEDIAKEFKKYQTLGTEVTTRTTLANKRDQRFSDLRDSLDLNKRHKDLDERRLYLADEINIRAEDYRLGLQEQLTETQVEAALLAKRNIAIETSVEFEKQRNAQVREIGDIERDLGVLRAQNANAEFVNERRNLAASREKYSLERQITDLQDELANQGVNDDLKIQLAYLQDVVSLRNRELDAVIAINRAELEMSKSMEISNNQIRARVYEHLAQQKTLNEAIADGIIGTYEAVADQAGKALDRLNEKTKGFLSFIIEPAKAIQRNILSNITKNIIDTVFPGMGDELTKTSNPIARPIVDEQKKTNKILERIAN